MTNKFISLKYQVLYIRNVISIVIFLIHKLYKLILLYLNMNKYSRYYQYKFHISYIFACRNIIMLGTRRNKTFRIVFSLDFSISTVLLVESYRSNKPPVKLAVLPEL